MSISLGALALEANLVQGNNNRNGNGNGKMLLLQFITHVMLIIMMIIGYIVLSILHDDGTPLLSALLGYLGARGVDFGYVRINGRTPGGRL